MNANIMKTHISYKMKYDLQGHQRSHKVIKNFKGDILLTVPLLFLLSRYASLFSLSRSSSLFLFFHPLPLNRLHIHPMPFYLFSLPLSSSLFFNLNLRSYGQLFVLVKLDLWFTKVCFIYKILYRMNLKEPKIRRVY